MFMNPVAVLEHMHINYSITNGYKRYITGPSSRMFMNHLRDASGFVPSRGTSKCNGLVSFQTLPNGGPYSIFRSEQSHSCHSSLVESLLLIVQSTFLKC